MKFTVTLLFSILIAFQCTAAGAPPENLKEAAEKADGVFIGLGLGHGTGAFPFMDFWVLDVLKGPDPGEKIGTAFPPDSISGIDIFKVRNTHGQVYIIAYGEPRDKFGRYTYMGPRFDSDKIIATPENASVVKSGSSLFEKPSLKQSIEDADVVAIGTVTSYKDEEANRIYWNITDIYKGSLPGRDITLVLGSRYMYWIFFGPGFPKRTAAIRSENSRILLIKKKGPQLYYAGPLFDSPDLDATPANLDKLRQLLGQDNFDWTWWIVGAAAAVVAFIAALVMSKIDYKYDRRRERLEKLRNRGDSDTDADKPGG